MDSHLLQLLLQYTKSLKIYQEKDINDSLVRCLDSTFLIESSRNLLSEMKSLEAEQEENLKEKQNKYESIVSELAAQCSNLLELVNNESEVDILIQEG